MATEMFYPIDITYKVIHDKAVIHAYGRTSDGRQICVIDESYPPYFLALPDGDPESLLKSLSNLAIPASDGRITNLSLVKKKLHAQEKEFVKVEVDLPRSVPILKDRLIKHKDVLDCFEYDIPFVRSWLFDKGVQPFSLLEIEGDYINQRSKVSVFRGERFELRTGESLASPKILSIALTRTSHFRLSEVGLQGEGFSNLLTVSAEKSEGEVIKELKEAISEYQPDILVGYDTEQGLAFLKDRSDRLGMRLDLGLDYSELRLRDAVLISGIVHIDLHRYFKHHDLPDLALGNIDEDDAIMTAKKVFAIMKEHLPHIIELSKLVGLPAVDITRKGDPQLAEWYLLRMGRASSVAAPNRQGQWKRDEPMPDTVILPPETGIYERIMAFDFQGFYPSVISAHNIGPDTLQCSCCEGQSNVPGEPLWICEKRRGFIPSIIEDLITRRMRISKMAHENKQLQERSKSLKQLANAAFPYLSLPGSRWHVPSVVKAITSFGRMHIGDAIQKIQDGNFQVIYADTENIFLTLGAASEESALALLEQINIELPGVMELERKELYPKGLFIGGGKKKYALLGKKDELTIRGFELTRKQLPPLVREVQRRLLEIALKEQDREKALLFVQTVIRRLREHKVAIEQLAITTTLKKRVEEYDLIGPHVAVAKQLQEKGQVITPGSTIRYVVTVGKELIRDRAKLLDDVSPEECDAEYYITHQVIPAVEQILEVLGIASEEIQPKAQSKLDKFFG
ncbi:MAG: DNA-directed DNA polymerase [Nanoarchaeota archaeon]